MSAWAELLRSLGVPLLFLAAWPRARGEGPEERMAHAAGLSLAWMQLGAMGMLAIGVLTPVAVVVWITLGLIVVRAWTARGAASVGLLALLPILLMATVPPWYRDELVYHLALPQQFAAAGRYVSPDDNIFVAFPMGWESIVAASIRLGGPTRLLGAWTMGAAALAAAGLARRIGGHPAIAAAALLLVPTVAEFGASAYVEPYLLLLTLLALRDVLDGRWTAGVWAGLAASVKYPGLAVALFTLVLLPRAARGRALVAIVSLGSPFYLRNILDRGNPVFPMMFSIFGGKGWDDVRAWGYGLTLEHYGAGRAWVDWLLLVPRVLTTRALHSGFQGSVGPMVLLGLLAVRKAPKLAVFALLWTLFWAVTVQQLRFWLPALAIGVVFASVRPAWLLAGTIVWSAGPLLELWRFQHTTPWLLGTETREQIEDALMPESAQIYRELPAHVPEGGRVWLVWMRGYTLDFPRDYRLDCVFEGWRMEELLDTAASPEDARARLDGFSHVLVNHRFFLQGANADWEEPGRTERLRGRWAALQASGVLRAVYSWGPVTLYAVSPGA